MDGMGQLNTLGPVVRSRRLLLSHLTVVLKYSKNT